jgi:lysine/ornithine N-monooxygenase
MNAGRYEVARRKFVDYLHLAFSQMLPLRYSAQVCLAASRPSAMATHRVKPSRPADGV